MARAHIAVVNGGTGFGQPVRVLPVRVSSDLLQQLQLHRTALIIPSEEKTQLQLQLQVCEQETLPESRAKGKIAFT